MSDVEGEIRVLVDDFVKGMRALARKAAFQSIAQHLGVDIRNSPVRFEIEVPAPAARSRPATVPESHGSSKIRALSRLGREGESHEKAAAAPRSSKTPMAAVERKSDTVAPRRKRGATRSEAQAPAAESTMQAGDERASDTGALGDEGALRTDAPNEAIQQAGTSGSSATEPKREGASVDETASTLLAHVAIEPGQGVEELALALGATVAELEEPIKKLLAENKITEAWRQGQVAYYPA